MRVISLLAQKGGVGKTTLTLHWAVEAHKHQYGRIAVIDMDQQESATRWYERRRQDYPLLLKANEDTIDRAVDACRAAGIDWVFIDTMPRVKGSSVAAARVADLSVIPCGPSVLDIEAIGRTIAITVAVRTPAVIVINRGRHSSGINAEARTVLERYDLPVCPTLVMRRAALEDAFIDGRAVTELKPNSKAAAEITASWRWIRNQIELLCQKPPPHP